MKAKKILLLLLLFSICGFAEDEAPDPEPAPALEDVAPPVVPTYNLDNSSSIFLETFESSVDQEFIAEDERESADAFKDGRILSPKLIEGVQNPAEIESIENDRYTEEFLLSADIDQKKGFAKERRTPQSDSELWRNLDTNPFNDSDLFGELGVGQSTDDESLTEESFF